MDKKLTLSVTQNMDCEDCTSEFFTEEQFPTDKYAIVRIPSGLYGVAERKSRRCRIIFEKITEMKGFCRYHAQIKNEEECFIYLSKEGLVDSGIFKKVIKIFEKFALVENLYGQRKLFGLESFRFYDYNVRNMSEPIIRLTNGKLTVINEKLDYLNTEFDAYKRKGDYIIAICESERKMSMIRILDLKESKSFASIEFLSDKFALCSDKDSNEYVMRLSDFAIATTWQN